MEYNLQLHLCCSLDHVLSIYLDSTCLELAHLLIEHVLWIDHGGGRGGHPRVDKVVLDRDEVVVVVVVAEHIHPASQTTLQNFAYLFTEQE